MTGSVTIGTRGSQLALWQAKYVQQQISKHFPNVEIQLQIIKTTGDTIQNRTLIGLGKGVFTKEIETALLNSEIDLAVHSLKDLPTALPDGLQIGAIPSREDPRDVLVTSNGALLEELHDGAHIGTTSPRRKAQLLCLRSDLHVVDVRGNVDTRLRKLQETDLDGIILAAAGIKRLLNDDVITQYFDVEQMVPAVGQGALAIETRVGDNVIEKLLAPLRDATATAEIAAERTVLECLGGGCQIPIGAYAIHQNDELSLIAAVCHPEGKLRIVERASGNMDNPQQLGEIVSKKLLDSGASDLLKITNNLL